MSQVRNIFPGSQGPVFLGFLVGKEFLVLFKKNKVGTPSDFIAEICKLIGGIFGHWYWRKDQDF